MVDHLIDKVDTSEMVRDQIAAILAIETANQQALAAAADKDADAWKLDIYSERTAPWEKWLNGSDDATPIVNVNFNNQTFDASASNIMERQKADGVFNIDCIAYGAAAPDGEGHKSGDREASLAAQRAARLVRNILMAATYTYLGFNAMPRPVGRRWVESTTMFYPAIGANAAPSMRAQQIVAARVSLAVQYNEFAPQVEPVTLELLSTTVKRAEDGEIVIRADYETE